MLSTQREGGGEERKCGEEGRSQIVKGFDGIKPRFYLVGSHPQWSQAGRVLMLPENR